MTSIVWELLDEVFTVEKIMTPRDRLLTWEPGTDRLAVLEEADKQGFDLIPVTEGDRIVGVIYSGEEVKPVTHEWLISSDTSIPDLLDLFVESERPGLLVLHCQAVVGIVTPADLNKIVFRVYLYNLIGRLEVGLAALVREYSLDDGERLLQLLSEDRREKLQKEQSKLAEGDTNVDPVQRLYLKELIAIIAKEHRLREGLSFASEETAISHFSGLVDLRNRTMHPVRPLIENTSVDLVEQHARIKRVLDIVQRMDRL